jgi:hypothetical protein
MSGDDFTARMPEKQPWESSGNLERRALARLEGDFQFKLAEAVLGAPFRQTMPLPKSAAQTRWSWRQNPGR